ncbi:MAG TPA: DUF885 domain-containing protein, partial [Xanthomonadales bacterium]|nr:DUF885 domain-containing protein [Xanthomonadales bacterium]
MQRQLTFIAGLVAAALLAFLVFRGSEKAAPPPAEPASPVETPVTAAQLVNALADEYFSAYFDQFPELSLFWGAADPDPARLTDNSLESTARWQILQQDLLAKLNEIDMAQLDERSAIITANMLRNQLENSLNLALCRNELWPVSPTFNSWLAMFTALAGKLKLDTPEQREASLARMEQMASYIDTEIANLRDGVELGYVAPKRLVQASNDVLDSFLALPAAETPFVMVVQQQDIGYQQRVTELVEQTIRPAVQRYRDYLGNEYAPSARDELGVSSSPGGEACYRASVRYWATLDIGAEEIHRIGLEQMEKVMAEMAEIGQRSFGESDPIALLRLVRTDPQYLFRSREEMVAYAEAALARAKVQMPKWFIRLPEAPVIIEPYPAFQEKSAPPGQAVPAAQDGSSPGKYLINTYQAEKQSRANLEAIAFHEAYPGHHTQFTIAQEREDLHPISRHFFLSGFGEGWGLYTERLADEMGLYSSDLDRLGMLSNIAWRAARMVVDSGMHGMGWSREQALDY